MAFIKRLGWYLVGLSIGIVFLTLFLKKKSEETGASFCYLPNCRVLKDLRAKPATFSDQVNAMIADKTIDSTTIDYFFNDGDIDFKSSDTKSTPCKIYYIDGEINQQEARLKVQNCTDKVVVETLTYTE